MQLNDMAQFISSKGISISVVLFMFLTLIQITPIKINPWDTILGLVGKMMNKEVTEEVRHLKKQMGEVKTDIEERTVNDMRWHILNFAQRCRMKQEHTKEQWQHVLMQCKKYETYIKEHNIDNGVIEEDTRFIRELYHRLSSEGRIK